MFTPLLAVLILPNSAIAGDEVLPELQPTLLVKTTATILDQDQSELADPGGYGDPENDPGFKVETVRMGFRGRDKTVKYGVTVGMSSPYDTVEEAQGGTPDLHIVDAYGGYSPVEDLWIVGGLQKVPVSREKLMASSDLSLSRRSAVSEWLAPSRDIGVVVDGRWSFIRSRVGIFNGGGDLRGDDNDGKLVAARLEGKFGEGNAYKTYGKVDGLLVSIGADGWMNSEQALTSTGYGVDVLFRFDGMAVLAEARFVSSEPKEDLIVVPGVLGETHSQGMMVQAGYTVGQLEPVVRFASFDDDDSVEDVGDVTEAMGGVTWHSAKDQVRAGVGYIARIERGPTKKDNDSVQAWFQLKL